MPISNWHASAVRLDRQYQGWGEVAGYYLDRALGLYRVPPIVGRYVSSKIYYYFDDSWIGRLLYLLPEHSIAVSAHAWLDDVKSSPPLLNYGTVCHDNIATVAAAIVLLLLAYAYGECTQARTCELSDLSHLSIVSMYESTVIFSCLIFLPMVLLHNVRHDKQAQCQHRGVCVCSIEYDRLGTHNWKRSNDGLLMTWDNGLAWNHGPLNCMINRSIDAILMAKPLTLWLGS
jgi:hypothetical protein